MWCTEPKPGPKMRFSSKYLPLMKESQKIFPSKNIIKLQTPNTELWVEKLYQPYPKMKLKHELNSEHKTKGMHIFVHPPCVCSAHACSLSGFSINWTYHSLLSAPLNRGLGAWLHSQLISVWSTFNGAINDKRFDCVWGCVCVWMCAHVQEFVLFTHTRK